MKKIIVLFAILVLALSCAEIRRASAEADQTVKVDYGTLLTDLMDAYTSVTRIDLDVKLLDDDIASAIAAHWKKVYLDDYQLYRYGVDDPSFLPITSAHAFVVLGYELKNGEMTRELVGRCDAAAAAAKAFPDSILVCSGGATGSNNPEKHTEAGLMKDYLVSACGIAPERVFLDKEAMTTTENAINTFAILRAQGVETITIVTSTYHQRWGQVLYNAMAAKYRQAYGYSVEIIGNYCYDVFPSNVLYLADAQFALTQLKSILALDLTGK
ncbi:MAG: YdcF family protein [Clostridia bacterium]|nr:YdcF family protein [Clostridia bacterium]